MFLNCRGLLEFTLLIDHSFVHVRSTKLQQPKLW